MKDSDWFRDQTLRTEATRIEIERHEKARAACYCEHGEPGPSDGLEEDGYFEPKAATDGPCWKLTYERGESFEGQWIHPEGWFPYRDPSEWCETCIRRQAHHRAVVALRKKVGTMRSTLTREARRIVRAGG